MSSRLDTQGFRYAHMLQAGSLYFFKRVWIQGRT